MHMTIGELHEKEALTAMDVDAKRQATTKAVKHYQLAGDYYYIEGPTSMEKSLQLKVATLAAGNGEYAVASKKFEDCALWEAGHPTPKSSSKSHFFHSLLCRLVIDVVDTKQALERYVHESPSFAGSRECAFIRALIPCVEEEAGPIHFEIIVIEYNINRAIDSPWMQSALEKLKDMCGDGDLDTDLC